MATSKPRRVYWDSCTFLSLMAKIEGRWETCRDIWTEAEGGRTVICTSFFTWAEVFKYPDEDNGPRPWDEAREADIQALLGAKHILPVLVDERIGKAARRLARSHRLRPADAIHVASAARMSVDEMHTYDGIKKSTGLLSLDQKIFMENGERMAIVLPKILPPPKTKGPTSGTGDLFEPPTS